MSSISSVNVWQKVFFSKLKAKCPVFHFFDLSRTILDLIQPKINKKRQNFCCYLKLFLFYPLYDFRILVQMYQAIIQFNQTQLTQKSSVKMLSLRWQNPQKNENTQTSEVNSNFFLEICWKHDTSLQSRGIHYSSALIPFYHYLFSRYLVLADRHFSSDILVPFPDSCNLCSCDPDQIRCIASQLHFLLRKVAMLAVYLASSATQDP